MSKSNVISPVPIVFIEQGKTPVTIIDFSSLPISAEIDLSLEGDSALWSQSEPALTLCILTMPYMYQFPLLWFYLHGCQNTNEQNWWGMCLTSGNFGHVTF